jgi:hypothetical protein
MHPVRLNGIQRTPGSLINTVKYRSGSRIEDSRYNDDLREGDAEGVDSVRKVAKHTSVPLSLLTLDNATICSIPQFPNLAQLDQRESSFSRAMIH